MKRRTITAIALSPVLIVVLLFALLISPIGAGLLASVANMTLPHLTIEGAKGGLADTMSFDRLSWKSESVDVEIGKTSFAIGWPNASNKTLAINDLTIEALNLTHKTSSSTDNEQSEPAVLSLPITVLLARTTFHNINIAVPTHTLKLDKLYLDALEVKDTLSIATLELGHFNVSATPLAQTPDVPDIPTSYALSYTPPELPEINAPFPITLTHFTIAEIHYQQGELDQRMTDIRLDTLSFAETKLVLQGVSATHELATLQLSANTNLSIPYELNLIGNTQFQFQNQPQRIDLNTSGALNSFDVSTKLTGAISGEILLNANVLNEYLPLHLNANWHQPLTPSTQSQAPVIILPGTLAVKGTMGDYTLLSNGGISHGAIGDAPFDIDVTLKTKHIYVNHANAKLFDGSVTNTGTLYLDESLYWDGTTTLSELALNKLYAGAPSTLNGQFYSVFQLSDKGIDANLSDISFDGILNALPLTASGNMVYSSASDLAVGNMRIGQGRNQVSLLAQLFNKRYLNARATVNIPHLQHINEVIRGALEGSFQASGPWQNPTVKATLSLSSLAALDNAPASIVKLGEANGEISYEGTFDNHAVNIDLALPDYRTNTLIRGIWENNIWRANMERSDISLHSVDWQLHAPFHITANTKTIEVEASPHCWDNHVKGQVCIHQLDYEPEQTSWSLDANTLPIGLWANEFMPHRVSSPSEAVLSFTSQGSVNAAGTVDTHFSATITPARWQFGQARPVELIINSFEAKGAFTNNDLTITTDLKTDNAGDLHADVALNPIDLTQPLHGTVSINHVDVAPFKPLFSTFRQFSGILNGQLALAGSPTNPDLTGQLTVSDGAISIYDAPLSLENWQHSIELQNRSATMDGTFLLGGGEGTLSGTLDWEEALKASLSLNGSHFEILQPTMTLMVSPDVNVLAREGRVDITGSITIPSATIEVNSLPESAVSPSNDVHLRGEPIKEAPLDIIHADVSVGIDTAKANAVHISAFGLTANLNGLINVKTQPALVGYGDLQINNGQYKAYGQQLLINKGEVQFNGPINSPSLLVEAIRDPKKTDDNVIAGVRIDGLATTPNIELFSTPGMNQQSVLSYLLTGKGPGGSNTDPNYGALLLGFGLSNTKGITTQVGDTLGIENLRLGTNEEMLSVTGQINDRLSIEYNVDVGLRNDDTNQSLRRRQGPPDLALKYQLLPQLFLEAVQNTIEEQTEFALDVYYEFYRGRPDDND